MSEPITRTETYLAALAGESVTLPTPITRTEMYLAYLNGMTDTYPAPITRSDYFLHNLCQQGLGGGGATIRNQDKTITVNGEYTADAGYTGLGKVTVNVPEGLPFDMGEFVLGEDSIAVSNIPHNLGKTPDFILVWSDDFAGTTNEYGNTTAVAKIYFRNLTKLIQRYSSTLSSEGLAVNVTQADADTMVRVASPTAASYGQYYGDSNELTFNVRQMASANTLYRAGVTYKYFVAAAWWDVGGDAQ